MKPLFVTGIGTGIGKTITSAILTEKLKADYWKPVQSGDLDNSDTNTVRGLVSNTTSVFHPETYRLTQPFSPHKSADLDGIVIHPENFILPKTSNKLIIEGAGGLMVPFTDTFYVVDLIKKLDAEVVLISKNYLGSINHTLLSIELLRSRHIAVKGIIFNGDSDSYSEDVIRKYSKVPYFANIPELTELNIKIISEMGNCISHWDF